MQLSPYLLIFAGGGAGSCLRYAVGGLVQNRSVMVFPWGTLAVNITGALIIGVFMEGMMRSTPNPQWRLFFAIGVLGGYTTFSTLCFEAIALLQARSYAHFAGYVLGTNVLGLAACWLGSAAWRRLAGD